MCAFGLVLGRGFLYKELPLEGFIDMFIENFLYPPFGGAMRSRILSKYRIRTHIKEFYFLKYIVLFCFNWLFTPSFERDILRDIYSVGVFVSKEDSLEYF